MLIPICVLLTEGKYLHSYKCTSLNKHCLNKLMINLGLYCHSTGDQLHWSRWALEHKFICEGERLLNHSHGQFQLYHIFMNFKVVFFNRKMEYYSILLTFFYIQHFCIRFSWYSSRRGFLCVQNMQCILRKCHVIKGI
jgi:hypothetical protein